MEDSLDYNLTRVIKELKDDLVALERTNGSVMVLNYGLHTVRSRSFPNFQELVQNIITLIKTGNNGGPFKSRVVWKTTTAPHKEKIRKQDKKRTSLRFLTNPVSKSLIYRTLKVATKIWVGSKGILG